MLYAFLVAKSLLVSYVASVRDTLADPEKMQGIKLSKDEKVNISHIEYYPTKHTRTILSSTTLP